MIKPVRDSILLEVPPKKKEEVTKSGIVMVTNEIAELPIFEIIDKGADCKTEASIGDKVLVGGSVHSTRKIPYEDKDYIVVPEESILAIVS
jgi:co-chaperonin GroES (HSP10)